MNLTSDDMKKLGLALAVCFAAYKFGPPVAKAAALSIGAVIIAKRVPIVSSAL
jgi:hypothetical protein